MIYGSMFSYEALGDERYGRIVANNGFLQALIKADYFLEYHLFFPTREEIEAFKENVFDHEKIKFLLLDDLSRYLSVHEYYVFHNFSPFLTKDIYLRDLYSKHIYPITGYTHSLAHQPFMSNYLFNLMSQPRSCDGIICSCRTALTIIHRLFDYMTDCYQPMFKADIEYKGQTSIIPIGVEDRKTSIKKSEARTHLGLSQDKIIYLNVARFSPSTKMDLFSIFELIREYPNPDALFVFTGAINKKDEYVSDLQAFIDQNSLSEKIMIRGNLVESDKEYFYAAADVYLGLADNFQETYGISIIEAMRYKLPVLAMDWDGFKDSVHDGVNGYRFGTYLFDDSDKISDIAPIVGAKFAFLFSQKTFIDKNDFFQKLDLLNQSADLRRKFGLESRKLVEKKYLWKKVIEQYMLFWSDLNQEARNLSKTHPALPSLRYPLVFYPHPTDWLKEQKAVLVITKKGKKTIEKNVGIDFYANLEGYLQLDVIIKLLQIFYQPKSVRSLWEEGHAFPGLTRQDILFQVAWMIKQNLLEIHSILS